MILEDKIRKKIQEIDTIAGKMPGIVMIHQLPDFVVRYMSKKGLEILGVTLDELVEMGPEYHNRFFNLEEINELIPRVTAFLERNDDEEILALFQQIRSGIKGPWVWYNTSLKILMRDDDGKPLLTIGFAIPVDPQHVLTHKISRLQEENNFLRENIHKFRVLSARERTLLKHFALGKTSAEIASELHLSILTINTHKKNIKQKLGTNNVYELAEYARAFDLI
jgi:DNA-binding CsgD family transcriptional regulator